MMRWLKGRFAALVEIAHRDSIGFTELVCGATLLIFRGLMLIQVNPIYWPFEVSLKLLGLQITEARWGTFLLLFGALQMLLAGSVHLMQRIVVAIVILAAFVVVAVAYIQSGLVFSQTVLGMMCVIALYFVLLVRLFIDQDTLRRKHRVLNAVQS